MTCPDSCRAVADGRWSDFQSSDFWDCFGSHGPSIGSYIKYIDWMLIGYPPNFVVHAVTDLMKRHHSLFHWDPACSQRIRLRLKDLSKLVKEEEAEIQLLSL